MHIYYSTRNNSGPWTLVRIVEVSVIGGVHFRRFHCKCGIVYGNKVILTYRLHSNVQKFH